jgi:hypothetical protein
MYTIFSAVLHRIVVYIPQMNQCRAPRDPCRRQACFISYFDFFARWKRTKAEEHFEFVKRKHSARYFERMVYITAEGTCQALASIVKKELNMVTGRFRSPFTCSACSPVRSLGNFRCYYEVTSLYWVTSICNNTGGAEGRPQYAVQFPNNRLRKQQLDCSRQHFSDLWS